MNRILDYRAPWLEQVGGVKWIDRHPFEIILGGFTGTIVSFCVILW